MKNMMTKLMSMILTLALVVGMIGIMPMKAEAEEATAYPVWDMTEPYEYTVVEPWSEEWIELRVSETGLYRLYSSDRGESDPYATIYTSEEDTLAYNDDDPYSWNFSLTVYLESGSVYYLEPTARTAGDTFKINAEFLETPEIELYEYSTISLFEGNNGEYRDDATGEQYFYYLYDSSLWNLRFKFDYAGKESEFYTYDEMQYSGYSVNFSDTQNESHWGVGEHFYTVSVLGQEFQVPVNIVECPFVSFVITKNPSAKYVLNDGNFIWESEEGYFLDARILSGMEAEFTRADGSTFTLDYEGICAAEYPISVGGTIIDGVGTHEVSCYIINSESTFEAEVIAAPEAQEISIGAEYENVDAGGYAWYSLRVENSERYYFYLNSHNGATGNISFRLFDENLNQIQSSDDSNSEGYDSECDLEEGQTYYICTYSYGYNNGFTLSVKEELKPTKIEVLGGPVQVTLNTNGYHYVAGDGQEYYCYYTGELLNGKTVRITYSDGTYKDYEYVPNMDIEGGTLNTYSDQETEPWVPGGNNILYLEYKDVECEIPVEVVVPSATPIKQDTEYTYDSAENVYYAFTPSQSGCYKLYSYDIGEYDPYARLYNSDFELLSYCDDTEGYAFALVYELEAGKTYYYEVSSYSDEGAIFCVKVTRQITATNLRVVSGEIVLIEDVDGDIWGENEEDYFRYSYYEQLSNMIFEVTLDDGTKHQLQVGESLNDVYLECDDNQYNEHWYRDSENYISVTWLNKTIQVPVTIVENPVIGVSFVNVETDPKYVFGDLNVMYEDEEGAYLLYPNRVEGLQMKVDYRDGSTQTFTLDEDREMNGYYVATEYIFVDAPGEYQATYTYMANKCTLTLQVVESPIASIEVIKDPTVVTIPNYAMPNFAGAIIKITYTDGTEKEIAVTEDMIRFDNYNAAFSIVTDDEEILCRSFWEGDITEAVWILHLQGMESIYDGIVYTNKEATDVKASNVTLDGKGMILAVTFNDGTKKEYVVDPFYVEKHVDYYSGMMKADGGFVAYDVYVSRTHPDGTVCSGGLYAFGRSGSFAETHTMTEVPAKAATCTADGNIAHYKCSCGQLFADRSGKEQLTAAQVKVAKHTKKYVKAVKATSKKNGNKAHYVCSCGKIYLDAAGKKPATKGDVTLAVVDKTSISKVTGKKKALTVKWKKKSGVTGYEVQVALKKNFKKGLKKATVKGAKKVSATIKGLKAKKTYYVRVRAYKLVNGKKFYSNWSKVVKKKTK